MTSNRLSGSVSPPLKAPVLTGAFNTGDTDHDNLLDVSETWQYTASHQVTQAELDAGTAIVNTATVTGTGDRRTRTTPRLRWSRQDPAPREGRSVPGGTADVAGETISYTLAVTNTGNAAIAGVVVTIRSRPTRRRFSSAASTSATPTRTICWMSARPGSTRPATR